MATEEVAVLPLHEFLAGLQSWQSDASDSHRAALDASFERLVSAYGLRGALLTADIPPLPTLTLRAGTLTTDADGRPGRERDVRSRQLATGSARAAGTMSVDVGEGGRTDEVFEAVDLALTAVAAQQQAVEQRRELDALDSAVRGIASIASVERVLQLIVDRVRDLVGAKYAALGIVGQFDQIEQFIVSGISDELRIKLGPPPRGHGLLGLIIRENRPLLIDDIETDPRRYGFPEHHPEMHSLLGVPVRTKGRTIGNLYLTDKLSAPTFDEADQELVERFALHAGIAIENARLHDEIGRLAIVEERERISQDLHDSIIQSLYAISLSLEDLPDVIAEDPREGAARADRAIDSIHATIRDIRNFIMGLQPELLATADLATGIRTLAAEFQANTMTDLELDLDEPLPEPAGDRGAHVLAITREALSNIARHSGATRATIALTADSDQLRLAISDNGRGFDVTGERSARQHGLTNLTSRAEQIGGTLTLRSRAGAGTTLELLIPIEGVQSTA